MTSGSPDTDAIHFALMRSSAIEAPPATNDFQRQRISLRHGVPVKGPQIRAFKLRFHGKTVLSDCPYVLRPIANHPVADKAFFFCEVTLQLRYA